MRIHKEGYRILFFMLIVYIAVVVSAFHFSDVQSFRIFVLLVCAVSYILVLQFFRSPQRMGNDGNDSTIMSPADGKIVVIEEVFEPEFFKEQRLQVSIFMSPFNVHVNRYPISGQVVFSKYHPGKYLVAWHPKSSTHNERTTVVVSQTVEKSILLRQIAGAVARRIVCYAKESNKVTKGEEMGFIKFGSRVDLFLPIGTSLSVKINDIVKGGDTIIGHF